MDMGMSMSMYMLHLQAHAAARPCLCCIDLNIQQLLDMDMQQHRPGYTAWTWAFKLGHEYAVWTLTCSTDMDMQHGREHGQTAWT